MTSPPPQDPFAPPPAGQGAGQPPHQAPPSHGGQPEYGAAAGTGSPQGYGQPPPPYGAPGYGQPPGYGPPVGYGQPQPGWGAPGAAPQTDTKAVWALVLAIGSYVLVPFVLAIIALVLASMSRRDIRASGGRLGGEGMVTAAKVLSWINIALCLLAVAFLLFVFGVLASAGFSEFGDYQPALG